MKPIFSKPTGNTTVSRLLLKDKYVAPKVSINYETLIKMKSYVEENKTEVAWLGMVDKTGEGFTITDVTLMQQDVSSATAEIHESGLQEYAERLIIEGRLDDLEKIRIWGHSHVNMTVSPSSQDEETFREYYLNCDYFIRIIANKKGELRLDIALLNEEVQYNNVCWDIIYPIEIKEIIEKKTILDKEFEALSQSMENFNKQIVNTAKDEIKKYVTVETPKYPIVVKNKYYTGTYDDNDYDYSFYENYYSSANKSDEDKEVVDVDSFLIPKIKIFTNTDQEEIIDIIEWFSEEEIETYMQYCRSPEMLKEQLKYFSEFYYNTNEDWEELFDAIETYFFVGDVAIA